ncbi:MAG: ABC transporter ATP-binding protein [Actinomycetota bacterium]
MAYTGLREVTVVHRDGSVALHEVTVLAGPGELLVILGPSGSGKSTLLRTIAGLTSVRSGEVVIAGERVTGLPTHKRNLAMVFEHSSLAPTLDVAANLGFGLTIRRLPEAEVHDRVLAQARGLHLTRVLSRKPHTLSAGERGQVGVGRAMVREPSAFLFDEPLAHLDAAHRGRMRRHVADVVKNTGVTALYVTHDPSDALAIADRVAVLRDGQVVQIGTPHDLYAYPADMLVADFVTSMPIGLLPARVVTSGAEAGYQVAARTLPLWASLPAELGEYVGRDVVLGLRVEDVHEGAHDDDPRRIQLPGIVEHVEFTGPDTLVTVRVAAPAVPVSRADGAGGDARLRARFGRTTSVRPGSTVALSVDASRAHVFDPATGLALLHPAAPA